MSQTTLIPSKNTGIWKERIKKGKNFRMVAQNTCIHTFTFRYEKNGNQIEWCPKCGYVIRVI